MRAVKGLGSVLFSRLYHAFGSCSGVFAASESDLLSISGVGWTLANEIRKGPDEKKVREELAGVSRFGLKTLVFIDAEYPPRLREISNRPPILYVRGNLLLEDRNSVAIVGTRNATNYGLRTATELAHLLAARGITIVSGLARGIDSAAHRGALGGGGRTIAVLGSGFQDPYPPENVVLIEEICMSGAVISEFPVNAPPDRGNFPARNRIISGMTLGTIVVEAPNKSGALITSRYALEHGREVFAVPGPVGQPHSIGTNALIRDGAKLVSNTEDILRELRPLLSWEPLPKSAEPALVPDRKEKKESVSRTKEKKETVVAKSRKLFETKKHAPPTLNAQESALIEMINNEPIHIDELTRRSGLASHKVASLLMAFEIDGLIQRTAGQMYIRV